jgi:type IV secretion system protein VirD4
MELFTQILNLCFEYKWVVAVAIVLMVLLKQPPTAEEAVTTEFNPDNAHGNAVFASTLKALRKAGLLGGKGVHVGYSPDGKHKLFYPGAGHLFLCAAARAGKGVSLIVNAILEWMDSLVVFDPKGELCCITGHFRRRFGKVFVLNPFGLWPEQMKGLFQAKYNPFVILDPDSPYFHAHCDKIAAAIIYEEGSHEKYWSDSARPLASGVIAAIARHEADPAKRNLVHVAELISSGDRLFRFCRNAMQSDDPYIKQKLQRFAIRPTPQNPPTHEMEGVIATAKTGFAFINGAIAESLKGSDFRFSDLKKKRGTTVYICLPLSVLDVSDKYFRLLLDCFMTELLDEGSRGKGRPLAIIDEAAQLGPHMKSLENAMGMAAGAAGLQIWCVFQNISQLKGMFEKTWTTFLQNCGVSMWFASRDLETQEVISKMAGTREVMQRSRSAVPDRRTGELVVTESVSQHRRELVQTHETNYLNEDEMLMFVERVNGPVKAKREKYFKCPEYRGKYRPNPYFRKR